MDQLTCCSCELHCTEGGSNKMYKVWIEQAPSATAMGYHVGFSYGRIGREPVSGYKLKGARWSSAATTYRKLIDQKMDRGYRLVAGPRQAPQSPDGWTAKELTSAPARPAAPPPRKPTDAPVRRRIILEED